MGALVNRRTARLLAPLATAALTLGLTGTAHSTTYSVDHAGSADFLTIQEAVSVCADGDTVVILPGTYTGPGNRDIDPGTANIHICSQDGRGSVTIDCEELARAFYIHGGQDTTTVLSGLVITGGNDEDEGGALRVGESSSVKITNSIIRECVADYRGGAINITGGLLVARSCSFTGCRSRSGGGIYARDATCVLYNCSFVLCKYTYAQQSEGGGVYAEDTECLIHRCLFKRCIARTGAGAKIIGGQADIRDSEFFWGYGPDGGGAVYAERCNPVISACVFRRNISLQGCALMAKESSPLIIDCTFTADYFEDIQYLIAIFTSAEEQPVISNCTVTAHRAWRFSRGLIAVANASPLIERCVLAFSHVGTAVYDAGGVCNPEITNCVVYGNAGGDSLFGYYHDNLFIDPLLCDIDAYDFGVCLNSPCLPAGNPWRARVGAHGAACGDCNSPVEPMSWGAIKALYR